VGKLSFAQRLIRTAQFRTDPKLAVRELCEAMGEIAAALLEREQAQGGQNDPGDASKLSPP
jgi:hypothetical protein